MTQTRTLGACLIGALFAAPFACTLGDEHGEITDLEAATSTCLSRSDEQITVVPGGTYDSRFRKDLPTNQHTFDMRGAVWKMDLIDDTKAVGAYRRLDGACISGAKVVGTQSRDLPWRAVKNTDGVRFVHEAGGSVGPMIAEGLWVDNVGDGFEPARYSSAAGLGYTWTLRHSYFRYIRDDVIENDACHGGLVDDVLVDNSFVFLSTRPGSGNDLRTGDSAPVIQVHNSLIHAGSEALGGRLWKWPGSSSSCTPEPVLDVRDTVLRVDRAGANLTFPRGTFDNVTLVWLGGGEYPEPLPPGVTVTDDVSVWDSARANWLSRHGCDEGGDNCTGLLGATSEPPYPEPDTDPDVPEPSDPSAGHATLMVQIGGGDDDAEEEADGSVKLRSSDLEMVEEASRQTIGLRFQNLAIPQGALITAAHLQFTADETDSADTSLFLRGHAVADAPAFVAQDGNLSGRPTTSASVSWDVPAWNQRGESSDRQRSPNLGPVIQEIVAHRDWRSGNAMAFIITGEGKRVAEAYNGEREKAAVLHIEYSTAEAEDAEAFEITSPVEGATVSGTVDIRADAPNATRVEFRVDSELRCIDSSSPFSCSWDTVAEGGGTVTLTALAVHEDGTTFLSAPVTVTVDHGGNDSSEPPPPPSGTIRVPEDYASIQDAIDAAGDGDLVLVGPGTYSGGLVVTGKAITLASHYFTTGDRTLVDDTVIDDGSPAIRVEASAAGTTVQGFRFIRGNKSVQIFGFARVLDNFFDNTGSDAISLENAGGIVRGNRCYSPSDDCIDGDGPMETLIEDNLIEGAGDDGIEIRNFTNSGSTVTVEIRDNRIIDSGEDGIQLIDYSGVARREFIIERNEIRDSVDAGLGLMDSGETVEDFRAASMPEKIVASNNTFVGNSHGISGGDNMVFVNNIVVGSSVLGLKNLDGNSIAAFNLFWDNGTDFAGSNIDTETTVTGDPGFTDDFQLSSASAAIDAGTATYIRGGETVVSVPSADIAGAAPDLGCYEHGL